MIEKLSDGTLELSFDDWPERDLNLLSHRRIDVAVLEIGLTEIFLPVGAIHRAIPISADRAAPAGPARPREKPASRRGRAKSRETRTLRWREMDSNHWSRHGETPLGRAMWFPRTG